MSNKKAFLARRMSIVVILDSGSEFQSAAVYNTATAPQPLANLTNEQQRAHPCFYQKPATEFSFGMWKKRTRTLPLRAIIWATRVRERNKKHNADNTNISYYMIIPPIPLLHRMSRINGNIQKRRIY